MAEQIISKRCSKCKEVKPVSEFHRCRAQKDGHQCYCKNCALKYNNEYHQTEKGKTMKQKADVRYLKTKRGKMTRRNSGKAYHIRHPEQIKAQYAVNYAIKIGKLARPDNLQCHYCPKQAKEYHHHKGYEPEHWLNVIPVCKKCHYHLPTEPLCDVP